MVSSQFQEILNQFAPYFGCPLVCDENESSIVQMNNGLEIQLEINPYGFLLIGCVIGTLTAGRYKNALFIQALKENHPPPIGRRFRV